MDLILSRGREVYEGGETATAARWLATVPESVLATRPDAVVVRGMVEGMSGRGAVAETLLRSVLGRADVAIGTQLVARAYASAGVQFHGPAERYLEDGHAVLAAVDAARDVATPDLLQITARPHVEMIAMVSIGRAHLFLGDLAESARWLRKALATEGASYVPYRIHALGSLAICRALAGRLTLATSSADEALDLAKELSLLTHPAVADAYIARALVAIQRGWPETGALALHEGYVRASSNNRTQLMWVAHAASRLVDPAGTDAAAIAPVGLPPALASDILHAIASRQKRGTARPIESASPATWCFSAFEAVAGALALQDGAGARNLLETIAIPRDLTPAQIVELHVLHGWLCAIDGHASESREHLERALEHAAAERLVHPFVRAGGPVITLIQALPADPGGFRAEVVARYQALRAPAETLADPLTARELELLAYLPSRLTNAELAARCFVSVNTVKTHVAHIYQKLHASGRDEAVARARELGLLKDADIAPAG